MIWKPHATVAAVIERDDHFLLVEEECGGQLVFNQPAGHLEPDESLINASIRETREETAWLFHPQHVTGIYQWKQTDKDRTFLRVAFCGPCDDHLADQPLDKGIIRAVWMTRDELLENSDKLRSPMVIRCIDDYLAGHRYPLDLLIDL
jgi:ADP-ribose pyrophosphatase YjhB (NUDIX family)